MALLLLRNEAACLVPDMKTELVSSRVPPELSRSPLPRERFRPSTHFGPSTQREINGSFERYKGRSPRHVVQRVIGHIGPSRDHHSAWTRTAATKKLERFHSGFRIAWGCW